jgi:hypothetical protein
MVISLEYRQRVSYATWGKSGAARLDARAFGKPLLYIRDVSTSSANVERS